MQIPYKDQQMYPLLPPTEQPPAPIELATCLQTSMPLLQITHKVIYGDTLQGLSLQYSVPISKLRQRNSISGDSIYHLKLIIIPNPQLIPPNKQQSQAMMIEEFIAHMDYKEKESKVARYYLGEAQWNIEEAVKEYRSDLEWERKNQMVLKSVPLQENQLIEIQRFYSKQELQGKKNK